MDKYRECQLKDVRLEGVLGAKMSRFFQHRILSDFARTEIIGEARCPIENRDDDLGMKAGGRWRGEFWGKQMLSAVRVADYTRDPGLLDFIVKECRRVISFQDEDGYLGSYTDKERVAFTPETLKIIMEDPAFGWTCLWNLWNRKYLIWAMLMAYKVTGEKDILDSVRRQMDQWIDMMHRLGVSLCDTGSTEFLGVASMSVLKPLVMLYEETQDRKYLDYAAEMLPDWDREDGTGVNFFRNAFLDKPLFQWIPKPAIWAKSYELMSCLDGLLEYYRATGEKRCLDTVAAIHDNLAKSEANPIGDVGYVDKFIGAAEYPNAATELCDTIHWIRLSCDLFLITGKDKYLDDMEVAYLNAFLGGVYRDGTWTAFSVRGAVRHEPNWQCNCAYNHCCVNNAPRTFMDMAAATVSRDAEGVFQVNFYQDATATLDDVTFQIRGNYPVGHHVTVTVSDPAAKVRFRKPGWCPNMDVKRAGDTYVLTFDMAPRIVERPQKCRKDDEAWAHNRYLLQPLYPSDHVVKEYRTTMAATMMYGPLVLARALRAGTPLEKLHAADTVNGQGCALKVTPRESEFCWGAWDAEILKDGRVLDSFPVCDFQSAADSPFAGPTGNVFSIWV